MADFDQFLRDVHAESINCTEDDCLDDDLPDAFDSWFQDVTAEQMFEYAEAFIAIKDAHIKDLENKIVALNTSVLMLNGELCGLRD